MALRTILHSMYRKPQNIEDYVTYLKAGKCKVISVNQETPAGRLMIKAKDLLLQMLQRRDSISEKLLRYSQLLDVSSSDIDELSTNYLEDKVEEGEIQKIIEDVEELLPNIIVTFPFHGIWGCTVFTGHIFLKDGLFENKDDKKGVAAVKIMFVLIHELAHLKKYIHLSQSKWLLKTPPRLQNICKDLPGSTGSKLEKYAFGGRPNLDRIGPGFVQALINSTVTEEQWNQVIAHGDLKPVSNLPMKNNYSSEDHDFESSYGVCGTKEMDFDQRSLELAERFSRW